MFSSVFSRIVVASTFVSAFYVRSTTAFVANGAHIFRVLCYIPDGDMSKATFYTPGLGACGVENTESDLVVAIPSAIFGPLDAGTHCGEDVIITCTCFWQRTHNT